MQPPLLSWQKAYKTRTTIELQTRLLSEIISTGVQADIIKQFDEFQQSINNLRHLYDFESNSTERASCDKGALGAKENRNTYEPIV